MPSLTELVEPDKIHESAQGRWGMVRDPELVCMSIITS